ncbi:MAG: sulfatase-like hydrolase/transferase [Verrucomicrobiota bacterium]
MKKTLLLLLALFTVHAQARKPNIVFMLVDDMGYADLSCYDAPDVKTPNIDRLGAEGVRFTQLYATGPECTPSRTGFLTGRYPQRVGGLECAIGTGNVGRYDDAIRLAEKNDLGLPSAKATLAPALKKAGYINGVFGKWHLGYEEKFNPLNQGFDEFIGFLGGNVEYFRHRELSDLEVYLKGTKPIQREGYMTHLINDDSIDFIQRNKKQPFFLYVAYSVPHFPFQGPDDDTGEMFPTETWTKGPRSKYVEMLVDMDHGVGKILEALKENNLVENTIVVFASDHGGMRPGINTPFRDFKGTLFEGGIRVPCVVRWPGRIKAGTVSDQPGTLMDLTASFLNLAGYEGPLDGIDLLEHVAAGKPDFPRTIFWRSKRGDRTWWAVRRHDQKYVRKQEGSSTEEWLFDLKADPSEKTDLGSAHPKKLNRLKSMLAAWENQVKANR